jgi:hypothetical protein
MRNPSHLLRVFVLVGALLAANSALGQDKPETSASGDGWAPVRHLEFTPDDIEGGVMAPDGTRIESIVRADYPSLIEIRAGFESEIVKMVEDL